MRFSRPRTGTVLGAIALFIALGGTAFAAGATVVNIADPTNSAHIAHVNSAGQLQTSGSTSVTNTVTTALAAPSAFVHAAQSNITASNGCVFVAQPPSGRALIVSNVLINVSDDPSPGAGQEVLIWPNASCDGAPAAVVNPPSVGETTVPFDPGFGIPAGSQLSAQVVGSVEADVNVNGYSVPSSQVPSTGPGAAEARSHS